jgi:GNAT superfamily N-acetyltransferase
MQPFSQIDNKLVFAFLSGRKYSMSINIKHTAQFTGKDDRLYYINKKVGNDHFNVFDANVLLTGLASGHYSGKAKIASAVFDTASIFSENTFTGYEFNNSILVDPGHRRKGIATALTLFAENYYQARYKPSGVLSEEMKGFAEYYSGKYQLNSVAIIGSRGISDYSFFCGIMRNIKPAPVRIVSGGARGVDTLAARYAGENKIHLLEIKPDYASHKRFAPILRNKSIVKFSSRVIALWDGTSPGTANTIEFARKMDKAVRVFICNSQKQSRQNTLKL